MIYMYGGPIGRDRITREIKYIKRTIYVKGYDREYLSIAYLIDAPDFAISDPYSLAEEVSVGQLAYRMVSRKDNVYKFELITHTKPR